MVLTWSPNFFLLNLNDCVPGCLMPNFGVLASILTDISYFLSVRGREKERELVCKGTKILSSAIAQRTKVLLIEGLRGGGEQW